MHAVSKKKNCSNLIHQLHNRWVAGLLPTCSRNDSLTRRPLIVFGQRFLYTDGYHYSLQCLCVRWLSSIWVCNASSHNGSHVQTTKLFNWGGSTALIGIPFCRQTPHRNTHVACSLSHAGCRMTSLRRLLSHALNLKRLNNKGTSFLLTGTHSHPKL